MIGRKCDTAEHVTGHANASTSHIMTPRRDDIPAPMQTQSNHLPGPQSGLGGRTTDPDVVKPPILDAMTMTTIHNTDQTHETDKKFTQTVVTPSRRGELCTMLS